MRTTMVPNGVNKPETYGAVYLTPLTVSGTIGKSHFEVWKAIFPDVKHTFVSSGGKMSSASANQQLVLTSAKDLKQFEVWWDNYCEKYSDKYTLLPEPKTGIRYTTLPLEIVEVPFDPLDLWVWINLNCKGHVAFLTGHACEYGISGNIYVLFEDDCDKTKYQLYWMK